MENFKSNIISVLELRNIWQIQGFRINWFLTFVCGWNSIVALNENFIQTRCVWMLNHWTGNLYKIGSKRDKKKPWDVSCSLWFIFKQITNKLVLKLQYKIITIVNVTYRSTELSQMLWYIYIQWYHWGNKYNYKQLCTQKPGNISNKYTVI